MPRLVTTIEIAGVLVDLTQLPEESCSRLIKELEFQAAIKTGGKDKWGRPIARYHGRDLRSQKCLAKAKAMHSWMAREMLTDAMEEPYLEAQDAVVAALDSRTRE